MPKYRQAERTKVAQGTQDAKPALETASTPLRSTIHAVIHKDGDFYVAECLELPVVTQGDSLDDAIKNLHEALCLHLEDEDLRSLGLAPEPRVEVIYDMGLACPA